MNENGDCVETLKELGLTYTQAKVYIAAAKREQANAKDLCKDTGVPKQELYRILSELANIGLVEKQIGSPTQFNSIPFLNGVSTLIANKRNEIDELATKAKKLQTQMRKTHTVKMQESRFLVLSRKYLMNGTTHSKTHKTLSKSWHLIRDLSVLLLLIQTSITILSKAASK